MHVFRKKSPWDRVTEPLGQLDGRSIVRSGLTAAATMVALSAASALTSVIRRRQEKS